MIDDDTLRRARLMVCANVDTSAEAQQVMEMLGIRPGQESDEFLTGPQNLPTLPSHLKADPSQRTMPRPRRIHTKRR